MTAAIRFEVAQEQVAAMSNRALAKLADSDALWQLGLRVGVQYEKLRGLVRRERLKRGQLKMTDLSPQERRELVDPSNPDLRALASGPIMDAAQRYLPAGKLTLAETRQREMATILSAQGIEACKGGDGETRLHRNDESPVGIADAPKGGSHDHHTE